MDEATIRKALEDWSAGLEIHEAHTWKQVGRCVYCADCGDRLYQGYLPKDRRPPRRAPAEPKATTEMRSRWRKE
jgi:hypothetical protein